MPDSGAVYQPTTVGYTYDSGGDGTGGGGGIRNGILRIMFRHEITSRKWIEWMLLSVALCFFVAGLGIMLVSLVSSETPTDTGGQVKEDEHSITVAPDVKEHVEDDAQSKVALGAGMMLVGLLLGFAWAWLRFFHRSKSPRNGMTGNSGQMLGGLNPSTDLLVGSTSQYGPVLTELPSQLKMKQSSSHEIPAVPLSDQEEETRTLMQDSTVTPAASVGANTIVNQIPG